MSSEPDDESVEERPTTYSTQDLELSVPLEEFVSLHPGTLTLGLESRRIQEKEQASRPRRPLLTVSEGCATPLPKPASRHVLARIDIKKALSPADSPSSEAAGAQDDLVDGILAEADEAIAALEAAIASSGTPELDSEGRTPPPATPLAARAVSILASLALQLKHQRPSRNGSTETRGVDDIEPSKRALPALGHGAALVGDKLEHPKVRAVFESGRRDGLVEAAQELRRVLDSGEVTLGALSALEDKLLELTTQAEARIVRESDRNQKDEADEA